MRSQVLRRGKVNKGNVGSLEKSEKSVARRKEEDFLGGGERLSVADALQGKRWIINNF